MTKLSTCPLCRTDLEWVAGAGDQADAALSSCPSCGSDLKLFVDIKARAEHYKQLAADLLSRGKIMEARSLTDSLPQLVGEQELVIFELQARLAMAEGKFEEALEHTQQCEEPAREVLLQELSAINSNSQVAKEQYNYALTAARQGQHKLAGEWLKSASGRDPQCAEIWQLKLKVDLAARNFISCYHDLKELDRLGARPAKYNTLEELLPPTA